MRSGDAACATQAKSDWYVVTLPVGDTVISSQPLLHNANGQAIYRLETDTSFALSKFSSQEIQTLEGIINTNKAALPMELKEIFLKDQWDNDYRSIKFTTQQFDKLKTFLNQNNQRDLSAKLLTKPIEPLDLAAVALLAKFIVLNNENVTFVKFSSNKVIDAYLPWINIFQFLFGKTFQTHVPNNPAQQLARFSACIARPSLLLATDVVVRAALCGDEDLARHMIASNPNYLLQRGNVTDYSGRKYDNLTPFQAALITGDIEMAEMLKPFFACLENGEAEMQNQVTELFPEGIKKHETDQKGKSKTEFEPRLNELIEAIKKASDENLAAALYNQCNNSILYLALKKFRDEFTELSQEKIFNPHYLLAAFEAYANKFDWNNPDPHWDKLDLLWRHVIGFVQRFLPATYAQAFVYNLYGIIENKHLCPRSFNFRDDSDFSFYPLPDFFTDSRFNFACDPDGGLWAYVGLPMCAAAYARNSHLIFRDYVEQKTTSLQDLLRRRERNQFTTP